MIELDMSWNQFPEDVLELALEKLSDHSSSSKLEKLNLSGTSVSGLSVG